MNPLEKLAHAYVAVIDHPEEYLDKVGQEDRAAMAARGRARQAAGTAPTLPAHAQAQLGRFQKAVNQALAAPVQPSSVQMAKK